jgi:hypothetical protein
VGLCGSCLRRARPRARCSQRRRSASRKRFRGTPTVRLSRSEARGGGVTKKPSLGLGWASLLCERKRPRTASARKIGELQAISLFADTLMDLVRELDEGPPRRPVRVNHCPTWTDRARPLCAGSSDVDLFRYGEGDIVLDSKIPCGAFALSVSRQQLHSSQVAGWPWFVGVRVCRKSFAPSPQL